MLLFVGFLGNADGLRLDVVRSQGYVCLSLLKKHFFFLNYGTLCYFFITFYCVFIANDNLVTKNGPIKNRTG